MEKGELKALLREKNATADFIHARYLHWNRDWTPGEIAELLCRTEPQVRAWLQLDLESVTGAAVYAASEGCAKMSAVSEETLT
jgi:hypothetical protein